MDGQRWSIHPYPAPRPLQRSLEKQIQRGVTQFTVFVLAPIFPTKHTHRRDSTSRDLMKKNVGKVRYLVDQNPRHVSTSRGLRRQRIVANRQLWRKRSAGILLRSRKNKGGGCDIYGGDQRQKKATRSELRRRFPRQHLIRSASHRGQLAAAKLNEAPATGRGREHHVVRGWWGRRWL